MGRCPVMLGRLGLALLSSRSWMQAVFPEPAASSRTLSPLQAWEFTLLPGRGYCEFNLYFPFGHCSVWLTSDSPQFSRISVMWKCPCSAATASGVTPDMSFWCTRLPFLSSSIRMSTLPTLAASCITVHFFLQTCSTQAPWATSVYVIS